LQPQIAAVCNTSRYSKPYMRVTVPLALLFVGSTLPLTAQNAAQPTCSSSALPDAAKAVASIRQQLHQQAVPEQDPHIPAAIATQLGQLKDALAHAADVAFNCAPPASDPEPLQKVLADALHANRTSAAETTIETKDKMEKGAYGSDLAVQVFQLSATPRFFEVNFRYGIECGDDNLILLYQAAETNTQPGWRQILRWDTPAYNTVADAFGDFIILTPITGDYHKPTWRFVVAHGHPGCERLPRTTDFSLDLLQPSSDPAKPTLAWHFDHPYTLLPTTVPRLATTEDTVDFRIQSGDPGKVRAKENSPKGEEIYRFRLTSTGQLEPIASNTAPADSVPTP
jgi:hypothetical protein